MSVNNPVSPKILAAAVGAGGSVVLSAFVIWFIGAAFYHVGFSAAVSDRAVAVVPAQVVGLVGLLLAIGLSAIPGYVVTDPQRSSGGATEPEPFEPSDSDLNPPDEDVDFDSPEPDETPDTEQPENPTDVQDETESAQITQTETQESFSADTVPHDSKPIYSSSS